MAYQRFFSIVIPAHNEESLLRKTLDCVVALNYPQDRYEAVVVENGSDDATHEIAKRYDSEHMNIRAYTSKEKGVSKARNWGLTQCSPQFEWVLFMDADTFLQPTFLQELNEYLEQHPKAGYGTTTVLLDDFSLVGRFWTHYINHSDRLIKVLHRIHIIRKDLTSKASYDEELSSGEDMKYGYALAKHGTYFFMRTKSVITSARRFQKKGYLKMFFINMQAAFPKKVLKKKGWEVIR
ncbi:MAG: glycosyltransferase family A protein [bacterium]